MCSSLSDWWWLLLSKLSRTELGNSAINQILPVGQVGQFRQQLIIKSDNVCWEVRSVYTRPCNDGEQSRKISITAHLGEVSVSLSFSPSFSLSNLKFWWSTDVNGSRQDWDTLSSPLHYLLLLLQVKYCWNVHFILVVDLLTTATPSQGRYDRFLRDLFLPRLAASKGQFLSVWLSRYPREGWPMVMVVMSVCWLEFPPSGVWLSHVCPVCLSLFTVSVTLSQAGNNNLWVGLNDDCCEKSEKRDLLSMGWPARLTVGRGPTVIFSWLVLKCTQMQRLTWCGIVCVLDVKYSFYLHLAND